MFYMKKIPSMITTSLLHYNYNHFTAFRTLSGTTRVSRYQKKHSPTTPIVVINHPLSVSSIYYDPRHPPCSIYVPDSLFHNLSPSFFGLLLSGLTKLLANNTPHLPANPVVDRDAFSALNVRCSWCFQF